MIHAGALAANHGLCRRTDGGADRMAHLMATLLPVEEFVEAGVLLAAVGLGFVLPRGKPAWYRRASDAFDAFARRPVAPIAAVFLLSLAGCIVFGFLKGVPEPVTHDEFAYLLAADTYAHFRLTNPTHPFWVHFESMHIFHQPTYMAKYPPGQGLALAVGLLLAGDPIVGVWLATAASCAATAWALRAWMPARWALAGGLLTVARCGIAGNGAQSYWGGAVAFLGGALLFGAVRRLADRPAAGPACAMAAGVAILANSRPFEGLVASLAAAIALAVSMLRGRFPLATWLTRVVAPAGILLALTAGAMLFNNHTVTGKATRLPYWVHNDTYTVISQFAWIAPRPAPEYRHEAMRRFFDEVERPYWTAQSTPGGFLREALAKLHRVAWSPCGALILLVAVAFRAFVRGWWLFAVLAVGSMWVAMISLTVVFPHYASPIAVLVIALVMRALRVLRTWRPPGRAGGATLPFGAAVMSAVLVGWLASWDAGVGAWGHIRAHLQHTLEDAATHPGKDLVIVSYGPEHYPDLEWVYNRADIDNAEVVWARDMGPGPNGALRAYFRDRTAWRLHIRRDDEEPVLERLPP